MLLKKPFFAGREWMGNIFHHQESGIVKKGRFANAN